jgi:protein-tyrosine phosphatase
MTTQTICLDDRIEGAVNFRDLGGLPADSGRVRLGMIYRSGMTHHISGSGLQRLSQEVGLRTVIDLRSPRELADFRSGWEDYDILHEHAPVLQDTAATMEELNRRFAELGTDGFDWASMYSDMLRTGAPAFRRVFAVLARTEALPAVFHCSGGRDRTGVTAALLLSVLDVSDELIARDYALTGVYLRPHRDRFSGPRRQLAIPPEAIERVLETTEDSMLRFLSVTRAEYGSVPGYVRAIGVESAELAALRAALIEPN